MVSNDTVSFRQVKVCSPCKRQETSLAARVRGGTLLIRRA